MTRSVAISTTTPNATKKTTTINYVNPTLSNEKALDMARRFNALTENTFVNATQIDKTVLAEKIDPEFTPKTLTIDGSSWPLVRGSTAALDGYYISTNYLGEDRKITLSGTIPKGVYACQFPGKPKQIAFTKDDGNYSGTGTAIITATLAGTETYSESSITITINNVGQLNTIL